MIWCPMSPLTITSEESCMRTIWAMQSGPEELLVCHFQDLLSRFKNQALKDTCGRVGCE